MNNQVYLHEERDYSKVRHLADATRGVSYDAVRYNHILHVIMRNLTAQNRFYNLVLDYRAGNGQAYIKLDSFIDYCLSSYNGNKQWTNDSIHESLKDKVYMLIVETA